MDRGWRHIEIDLAADDGCSDVVWPAAKKMLFGDLLA
jgi:hypothetical protein